MSATDIRQHVDGSLALPLRDRLETLLEQVTADTAALQRDLAFRTEEPLRLVLTGATSSGKSTLVSALTDREVEPATGVAPTTDTIDAHPWGSVVLVDTPGISGGQQEHDALAEQSLREADFVLFTLTHHGFEPEVHSYLMHIVEDLKLAPQTIIVINKADQSELDDAGRQKQLADDLGRAAKKVRWVACSAAEYLEGLEDEDVEAQERSRVPAVREALLKIAEEQEFVARARTPLQTVARVAKEALDLLEQDLTAEESQQALELLERRREVCMARRSAVEETLDAAYHQFHSRAQEIADAYAEAAEQAEFDPSRLSAAAEAAGAEFTQAQEQFRSTLTAGVQRQQEELHAELTAVWPEAVERVGLDSGEEDPEEPAAVGVAGQPEEGPKKKERFARTKQTGAMSKVREGLGWAARNPKKVWDHRFGKAEFSVGDQVISTAEKLLMRSKYSPDAAIAHSSRISSALGKVPMGLLVDLSTGLTGDVRELRAESKATAELQERRRRTRQLVMEPCEAEAQRVLEPLRAAAEDAFLPLLEDVEAQSVAARSVLDERAALVKGITDVQEEALQELERIGGQGGWRLLRGRKGRTDE